MEINGKWNEEVRKILEEDCIKNGYPTTDKDLLEALTEAETVYEDNDQGSRRWWKDVFRVVKIGELFIGYDWAIVTGDRSLSDTGWEFNCNSAVIVVPKTITSVIYVEKEG